MSAGTAEAQALERHRERVFWASVGGLLGSAVMFVVAIFSPIENAREAAEEARKAEKEYRSLLDEYTTELNAREKQIEGIYVRAENAIGVSLYDENIMDPEMLRAFDLDLYLLTRKCRAQLKAGKLEEGLETCTTAIAQAELVSNAPKNAWAYSLRCWARTLEGKIELAERDCGQARDSAPNFAPTHVNWGYLESTRGNHALAITYYEKALSLSSSYEQALNNAAWILSTCKSAAIRDGTKALEYAKKAVALDPESYRYQEVLAAAFAEIGDVTEAREILESLQLRKDLNDEYRQYVVEDLMQLSAIGRIRDPSCVGTPPT